MTRSSNIFSSLVVAGVTLLVVAVLGAPAWAAAGVFLISYQVSMVDGEVIQAVENL